MPNHACAGMKVFVQNGQAAVQPSGLHQGRGPVDTLSVDLNSGSAQVCLFSWNGLNYDAGVAGCWCYLMVLGAHGQHSHEQSPAMCAPVACTMKSQARTSYISPDGLIMEKNARGLH